MALTRALLPLVVAAVVAGPLLGCADFESEEVVLDLRPLAATAEPPEIFVIVADGSDLGLVVKVTADPSPSRVTWLVVNPKAPAVPMNVSIEACLVTDDRRCDPEGTTLPLGTLTAPPGTFGVDFAPTAAQLNTWLAEDAYRGFGGLYVMLVARVEQAGFPPDRVAKLVTYNVPFVPRGEGQDPPPPKLPNQNPMLDAVRIGDVETTVDGEVVELAAGRRVELEPLFDREAIEQTYPVVTFPTGAGEVPGYRVLTETFEIKFWVTEGLDVGATELHSRSALGDRTDFVTGITAPVTPGSDATLYAIIRDDRGGESFTTRIIRAR